MPKTLLENIIFTIIMAAIMVYGMIVYNVALATGGVTNATFVMALHEMPIMVSHCLRAGIFRGGETGHGLAFMFMRPTDRPQFITYAISLMIVCIMCPVMSLIATVLFKEPELWHLGAYLGLQYAHGPVLAAAVLRAAYPCHLPAGVPPRGKADGLRRFAWIWNYNKYV